MTAAHAIDAAEGGGVIVGVHETLLEVAGSAIRSAVPAGGRRNDRIDLGLLHLPKEPVKDSGARIVSVDELDLEASPDPERFYLVVGLPGTKQSDRISGGELQGYVYPLLATALPAEVDSELGHVIHLDLKVDRREIFVEGEQRTAPSFKGMSGCGVWGLGRAPTGHLVARLSGVLIEYHKNQRTLRSTRPLLFLDALKTTRPSLFPE